MDPGNNHTLSEEELNNYSTELDELFQSLIPLLLELEQNTDSQE